MDSNTQNDLLINMTGLSSILSIIGAIVIITLTMRFKIRNYFADLLCYLSTSDLIFAISSLCLTNITTTGFLLYIIEFLAGFGFYSAIFWTNCILLHSYFCIKHHLPLRKYEAICLGVCYGVPFILSVFILILTNKTFLGLLPGNLDANATQWFLKIVPMGLTFIVMVAVGTLVALALRKEGLDLTKRNDEAHNARDFLIFPILLIITWIPSVIFMISYASSQSVSSIAVNSTSQYLAESPSQALAATDGFFFGLQGFLDALFYFCTYEVRRKLFGEVRNQLTTRLIDDKNTPLNTYSLLQNFSEKESDSAREVRRESDVEIAPPGKTSIVGKTPSTIERENTEKTSLNFVNQINLLQRNSQLSAVTGSNNNPMSTRVSHKIEDSEGEKNRNIPTGISKNASRDPSVVSKKPVFSLSEENSQEEQIKDSEDTEAQFSTRNTMKAGQAVKEVSAEFEDESGDKDEQEEGEDELKFITEEDIVEEPKQMLDMAQYEIEFKKSNIPFRRSLAKKTIQVQQDDRISALEKQVVSVTQKLEAQGIGEIGMVLGIDCTSSNITSGKKSFGYRPLHHISKVNLNFYEQVIGILGSIANKFSRDGRFPVYLFGDGKTRGHAVRPLYIDPDDESHECYGIEHALQHYRKKIRKVELSGPTSFKPLIEKALEIVEVKGNFQILIIIGDGELTDVEQTRDTIIKASEFPLGIIMVGVGDGDVKTYPKDPWLGMKKFEKSLPGRKFENFTFVQYEKGMQPDTFAQLALRNIRAAYWYCVENDLVSEEDSSYAPEPLHNK